MKVGKYEIGDGHTFVIAEISSNHCQDYGKAEQLILAAKEAGADAVKLQCFAADSMTLDCDAEPFRIKDGLWAGQTLYQLYQKAATPHEWFPRLKHCADEIGIILFATPFSPVDVDFLEMIDVPCYKVASFEIGYIEFLERIAQTGKPCFFSTGCSEDMYETGQAIRMLGGKEKAIPLHCISKYPAPPEEMALRTVTGLSQQYGRFQGISDHSRGIGIAIAAVAMGAAVVEKHIKLPDSKGLDAEFSITPNEFKLMVDSIRVVEKALPGSLLQGHEPSPYKRSLWVAEDIKKGEKFTRKNIRAIRPNSGCHCRHLKEILDKTASCDIEYGSAMKMEYVEKDNE